MPLSQADLAAVLDALEAINAAVDPGAFPGLALATLAALISYDFGLFLVVDHARRRVLNWAQEPVEVRLPLLQWTYERHLPEHFLLAHFQRTGETRACKMSEFLSLAEFEALDLYREFYGRLGLKYQLGIALPPRRPFFVWIELNRARADFSERDRFILSLLGPQLLQAERNVASLAQMRELGTMLTEAAENLGLVALTRTFEIRWAATRARQLLAKYFEDGRAAGTALPWDVQRWARRHQSAPPGPTRPRQPLMVERGEHCLLVRLLPGQGQGLLLLEELPSRLNALSLEGLGLTRREADVVRLLAQGKTNAEIARALSLSSRTVGKHLEHIYAKLQVDRRTAAVARALALLNPPPDSGADGGAEPEP